MAKNYSMNGAEFAELSRGLQSLKDSTATKITGGGMTVELGGRCSPYKSHRRVTYGVDEGEKQVYGIRFDNGKHLIEVLPRYEWVGESESYDHLRQDGYLPGEQTFGPDGSSNWEYDSAAHFGTIPYEFIQALIEQADKYLGWNIIQNMRLEAPPYGSPLVIVLIRMRIVASWGEDGTPVYALRERPAMAADAPEPSDDYSGPSILARLAAANDDDDDYLGPLKADVIV